MAVINVPRNPNDLAFRQRSNRGALNAVTEILVTRELDNQLQKEADTVFSALETAPDQESARQAINDARPVIQERFGDAFEQTFATRFPPIVEKLIRTASGKLEARQVPEGRTVDLAPGEEIALTTDPYSILVTEKNGTQRLIPAGSEQEATEIAGGLGETVQNARVLDPFETGLQERIIDDQLQRSSQDIQARSLELQDIDRIARFTALQANDPNVSLAGVTNLINVEDDIRQELMARNATLASGDLAILQEPNQQRAFAEGMSISETVMARGGTKRVARDIGYVTQLMLQTDDDPTNTFGINNLNALDDLVVDGDINTPQTVVDVVQDVLQRVEGNPNLVEFDPLRPVETVFRVRTTPGGPLINIALINGRVVPVPINLNPES